MTSTVRVFQEAARLYAPAASKAEVSATTMSDAEFTQAYEALLVLQRITQDLGVQLAALFSGDKARYEAALVDATDLVRLIMYLVCIPLGGDNFKTKKQWPISEMRDRMDRLNQAIKLAQVAQQKFDEAFAAAQGGKGDWDDYILEGARLLKKASSELKQAYDTLQKTKDMELLAMLQPLSTIATQFNTVGTLFKGKKPTDQDWKNATTEFPNLKTWVTTNIPVFIQNWNASLALANQAMNQLLESVKDFEKAHTYIAENLDGICSKHALPQIKDLYVELSKAAVKDQPAIPCLGLTELLLRIVAQGCGSIDNFLDVIQGLKIRGNDGDSVISPYPAVVFACAGKERNNPKFVITTSMDHWDWCKPLDEAIKRIRHQVRPNAQPIVQDAAAAAQFRVDALSNASKADFVNGENGAPTNETNDQRRVRRQKLITDWRNGDARHFFHHGQEYGLPLQCPTLLPMHRCFRCQHLFDYNVGANVIQAEAKMLGKKDYTYNLGWLCAETYATYYCTAAAH